MPEPWLKNQYKGFGGYGQADVWKRSHDSMMMRAPAALNDIRVPTHPYRVESLFSIKLEVNMAQN